MPLTEEDLKVRVAQLEAMVEEKSALLEHANNELQTLAYSVSHDLRSPLRGIDGWCQALIEDYEATLDDTAKTYLSRVQSEAHRMNELIEALLKLSRISRKEMNLEEVNLSELAQICINKLQEQYPERNVQVNIEPEIKVIGDKYQLEIALACLIDNAWKFSIHEEVARIDFGTDIINGSRVYFVRDNGVGFNKSYARNLFGVFQRMHRPADFPGIGIGLALTQRIILRHGGTIWVETSPDEGATFYWNIRSN
jgi:light-regulated signal transduction histidine kinase (bacteriophytochrome)